MAVRSTQGKIRVVRSTHGGRGVILCVCVCTEPTHILFSEYMKLTLHTIHTCNHHETLCIFPACVNPVVMHDHIYAG